MDEFEQARWTIVELQRNQTERPTKAGRLALKAAKIDNYLGSGMEKTVFDLGNGKAVAIFPDYEEAHAQAARMKTYYYTGKIARLLMPKNVPNIYVASSQPPYLVVDRVQAGDMIEDDELYQARYALRRRLEPMGLENAIDFNSDNFIYDTYGELVYVDAVNPNHLIGNSELEAYIDGLKPSQRRRARHFQARLLENLDLIRPERCD